MGSQAKVTDPYIFDHLKAALTKFESEAGEAVTSANHAIQETKNWLEERFGYWNAQVNRYKHALQDAQSAMQRCQSATNSTSEKDKKQRKDCSSEAQAVIQAKRSLEEAENQLRVAKKYKDDFLALEEGFHARAQGFRENLNSQVASANKELDSHQIDIERYQASRTIFSEMYKAALASGVIAQSDGSISFPEAPNALVMPNGDAFGSYDELKAALKDWQLKAVRNSDLSGIEAHHLLENSQMQTFGFSRGELPCVALDSDEHMNLVHGNDDGSRIGLNAHFSSGGRGDIWDIVDSHVETYTSIGRTEWAGAVKDYVRANGDRIISAYETGQVSWSTPALVNQVKQYISSL